MRTLLLGLGILFTAGAMTAGARAQNYPWCAYYGGGEWGTNCGFTTYEQCRATVSGIGGSCARNTQYVPPEHQPVPQSPVPGRQTRCPSPNCSPPGR